MRKLTTTQKRLRNLLLTLTMIAVTQSCDKTHNPSAVGSTGPTCTAATVAATKSLQQYNENIPGDDLFEDALISANSDSSNDKLTGLTSRKRRNVYVKIENLKALFRTNDTNQFILPLFDDKKINVTVKEIKKYSDNNFVVKGQIGDDVLSSVTLVVNNDVVLANVIDEKKQEHYEITFRGEGIHTIQEVTGDDHDENCLTVDGGNPLNTNGFEKTSESSDEVSIMANPVIDVLVAYTATARAQVGGTNAILALIQMGISDSNKAYADSGVAMSLRLVGTMEVAQKESSFSSDLSALRGTSDGKWDAVHAARTKAGADLVSLIAAYSNTTTMGIGYIGSSYSTGFSITRTTAFKQFSFTHELGHNLGLNHSDGYQNASGRFRTIMAYGTYTRIPRFSNPLYKYNNFITGTTSNNSARILNLNGSKISNLTQSKVLSSEPPVVTPPPIADGENNGESCAASTDIGSN